MTTNTGNWLLDAALTSGLFTCSIILGDIHALIQGIPDGILWFAQVGAACGAMLMCLKGFFGVDYKKIKEYIHAPKGNKEDKDK